MQTNNSGLPRCFSYSVKSKNLTSALFCIDTAIVALFSLAYLALLIGTSLGFSLKEGLMVLVLGAVPFALVSLFRRFLDAPRPYQLYPEIPNTSGRVGRSMPSRHVFSAFLIASLYSAYSPFLALVLAAFGACLGACRVLRGIHFVRDVVAGALIGVLSGTIGTIILIFL